MPAWVGLWNPAQREGWTRSPRSTTQNGKWAGIQQGHSGMPQDQGPQSKWRTLHPAPGSPLGSSHRSALMTQCHVL